MMQAPGTLLPGAIPWAQGTNPWAQVTNPWGQGAFPWAQGGVGTGPQVASVPGAPGGMVLPGGTAENPLAMGLSPMPPVVTLPLTHLRQLSVHNLDISRDTNAPVTVVAEVDVSNLIALRDQVKEGFERQTGIPLTYLPFFLRATVRALMAFPLLNSALTPQGFIIPRYINVGVATHVPGAVLLPTIWNCERKGVLDLAHDVHIQTQRAKSGTMPITEMSEQTFIVTNTGRWGKTLFGTPVIKPPNVGVLAFESIMKRPIVTEDDQIVARPMMYLALTADHRAVDGADMIGFIGTVKDSLEQLRF